MPGALEDEVGVLEKKERALEAGALEDVFGALGT